MTAAVEEATGSPAFLSTARGRLVLLVLAAAGFLDFVDSSIVNVALPDIGADLGFRLHDLQWVISAYLLTYGGFMLLGGRMADLIGRRRVLLVGTVLFAASSLLAGLAQAEGMLIGARLAQGLGAALMVPAALSMLTTEFVGPERRRVLAIWGGVAGLGSAVGVLAGGLFTQGPGWRWIFFVNPPIAAALIVAALVLLPADHPDRGRSRGQLDVLGAVLVTGGMLLLVYALVKAPDHGWGSGRTVLQLVGAASVLGLFIAVELASPRPLVPLSIFRVRGLAAADVTQLLGVGGFCTMFLFVTLYLQRVLDFSPIQAGLAYLPATVVLGVSVGIAAPAIGRWGTRAVIAAGALVTALGLYLLSGIDVGGSYATDVLPGLLVVALGIGGVFVGTTTAANAGVPPSAAGLAAALVNASQQIGAALGLAVVSAVATSHTSHLIAHGADRLTALTDGFGRALLAASLFLVAAAAVALLTTDTHGEDLIEGDPR